MKGRHFRTAAAFRSWLDAHHAGKMELWVRFYNKQSGRGGLSYPEAVEQALCYGWIDGIVRKVDADSYVQRFTPRRPRSNWSAVNVKRFTALRAAGLVAAPGSRAFEAWDGRKAPYSFESRTMTLAPALERQFKSHGEAWAWFSARPAGYRRIACFWVMSAKKPETRQRRLDTLIAHGGG